MPSRPEFAWVIVAAWSNSADTLHGPFEYVEHANEWAAVALDSDPACTVWRLEILQPAGDRQHSLTDAGDRSGSSS